MPKPVNLDDEFHTALKILSAKVKEDMKLIIQKKLLRDHKFVKCLSEAKRGVKHG